MIVRIEAYLRRFRRMFSRSQWLVKILNLSRQKDASTKPGLVMVQIDGLSLTHLERGMKESRMPFLSSLIREEGYKKYPHYAGIPSNTPAVQGALFYGVKSCVPAFSFKHRESGQIHMLFNPASASAIQKYMEEKTGDPGLLAGGSAYGNIFTGGAKEAHFCAAGMGWGSMWKAVNPLGFPLTLLLNLHVVARAALFTAVELAMALGDCLRGVLSGRDIKKELIFIPLRMAVCVLLRDASAEGAKIDIARGLPVIHINLAGFDEQAHHRGPSSRFALWALKGIDNAIKGIYKAARSSELRDYDVFVYSDHGQEDVNPYRAEFGRTIQEAVTEIFKEKIEVEKWHMDFNRGPYGGRAYLMRNKERRRRPRPVPAPPAEEAEKNPQVIVTAMGPVGHIYPPVPLTSDEKEKMAAALVETAKIPFAIVHEGPGRATAWNARGKFTLPEEGKEIIDPLHPFFENIVRDLVELSHHEDAGEILIFGWRDGGLKPLTFMGELGSHAGPGKVETNAFALLPQDAIPGPAGRTIDTFEIREAAQRALGRDDDKPYCVLRSPEPASTLKLMTYNVHGCMGRDGKVSPLRIARIIARQNPDVVCLQELDTDERVHQAEVIAQKLAMTFHYFSSLKKERRGNAVLSRYPVKLVKSGPLPRIAPTRLLEPRGAIWVELDVHGRKVQLLNTHLSLSPQEAFRQSDALMGPDWLGPLENKKDVIVCGDFNAAQSSKVCGRLCATFKNVQDDLKNHRVLKTLPSYYPVRAIDHVFIGSGIKTIKVEVPRTGLERIASDHLPLVAELEILAD
jgi:endonuclease/exonuclease/phosphatase family metal-dependent hydrolase